MRLSPNFELAEFVVSREGGARGIDNTPPPALLDNLRKVALALEQIRAVALNGAPILITSGYRCSRLNALVGGSPSSAHMEGSRPTSSRRTSAPRPTCATRSCATTWRSISSSTSTTGSTSPRPRMRTRSSPTRATASTPWHPREGLTTMLKEFLGLIFVAPWTAAMFFVAPSRFNEEAWPLLVLAYAFVVVGYVPGVLLMIVWVIILCVWRSGRALLARAMAKKEKPAS
jgi:hypothetical protein